MAVTSFTGGEKLEAKLKELASKLSKPRTLKVGFLEGATYPDGTSVAMVAATQEFGAPGAGIPPRPFFRPMIAEKSDSWGKALGGLMKADDCEPDKALATMGQGISGQLQASIIAVEAPPLSPVTLMLREMMHQDPDLVVSGKTVGEAAERVSAGKDYSGASTKPLDFTGHLLASVDYEVK